MSKTFRFRQFVLKQDKSAQRMSTDSMVLGAVAELEGAMNILDIGTGTGVLALMMAQKHPEALVDAVEIDPESAAEANENFTHSPWAFRLACYAESLQNFIKDETLHYDLIVSNPPYFEPVRTEKGNNLEWPDERRLDARTQSGLTFSDLLNAVSRVMVSYGRFFVVLPVGATETFVREAIERAIFPFSRLNLAHDADSQIHRVIMGFQKTRAELTESTLLLWDSAGNRTSDYQKLTADFHHKQTEF